MLVFCARGFEGGCTQYQQLTQRRYGIHAFRPMWIIKRCSGSTSQILFVRSSCSFCLRHCVEVCWPQSSPGVIHMDSAQHGHVHVRVKPPKIPTSPLVLVFWNRCVGLFAHRIWYVGIAIVFHCGFQSQRWIGCTKPTVLCWSLKSYPSRAWVHQWGGDFSNNKNRVSSSNTPSKTSPRIGGPCCPNMP